MKKYTIILPALLSCLLLSFTTQEVTVYRSNSGNISFYSHTAVEDIKAENHKVKSAFSTESGKIQFSLLVKDFEFEKALMQEHFNENYMESTKYPRSTFSGTIDDLAAIEWTMPGTYTSTITGKLTIKDVTKTVTTPASFVVNANGVAAKAVFSVNPEEYNISIPKLVTDNISRNIQVTVTVDYLTNP